MSILALLVACAPPDEKRNKEYKSSSNSRGVEVVVIKETRIALRALELPQRMKMSDFKIMVHPSYRNSEYKMEEQESKEVDHDAYEWFTFDSWVGQFYDPPRGRRAYLVTSSWVGIGVPQPGNSATGKNPRDSALGRWYGEKGKRYTGEFLVMELIEPVDQNDYEWIKELCPDPKYHPKSKSVFISMQNLLRTMQ